uniref:DUF3300 domain-containing protein n=1 Tax=Arthrobacter sp. TaxID=1667 RepID=UPI0025910678
APQAQKAAKPAAPALTQAQLDQLLAPVALFPDQLLGQVLMASTYPIEVVEAARWIAIPANRDLKGDALFKALKAQHWDPSVMALVPFPRVLKAMSTDIRWTERLGNAFLAQQADVMASVQRLRHEAMDAGNLKTSPECHCVVETKGNIITVRSANPDVVYVPVCYTPKVYGEWRYPDYPPVAFPVPVGVVFAPATFVVFDVGVVLTPYRPLWGWSSLDWNRGVVIINPVALAAIVGTGIAFADNIWVHDPAHRGGALYTDPAVRGRFDGARVAALRGAFHAKAATSGIRAAGHGSRWRSGMRSGRHQRVIGRHFGRGRHRTFAYGRGHFHGGRHGVGHLSVGRGSTRAFSVGHGSAHGFGHGGPHGFAGGFGGGRGPRGGGGGHGGGHGHH